LPDHKNGQYPSHSIEAKSLPHFGKEQVPKLLWILTFERLDLLQSDFAAAHESIEVVEFLMNGTWERL
jgi:hypothetical protein